MVWRWPLVRRTVKPRPDPLADPPGQWDNAAGAQGAGPEVCAIRNVPQARQRAAKGAAPKLALPPSTRVGGTGPIYLIRSPRSPALGRRRVTPVPFPG